ncbi:hypothetical protein VSX64_23920 [Aurantimonas sp. C2-6-R+9]|uniref:hypothetical protein n=1 Tax=unclassified Aurantimonas TaxID=2638230 RepID=UPI002E18DACA|nr:hypothetical protein [Aurantimonas sp. C2-6-R+9]
MRSQATSPRRATHPAPTGVRGPMIRAAHAALSLAAASLFLAGPALAQATPDTEAMIADALRAAPANIRDTATISDLAGHVLRQGTSDYTCFPAPSGIAGPMCMDGEWQRWMAAWMGGTPFTAEHVAIAYMLAGDSPDGGASNIDPAAGAPTVGNEWIVEGPHMMVITPDPAAFEGLPTTIGTDGPYVMWPGTPYVHLMVPVAARPEQRSIPSR